MKIINKNGIKEDIAIVASVNGGYSCKLPLKIIESNFKYFSLTSEKNQKINKKLSLKLDYIVGETYDEVKIRLIQYCKENNLICEED